MKKILITGACGQIGTELTHTLRKIYGVENVVATNIRSGNNETVEKDGIFELLDVTDYDRLLELMKKYEIDTIMNLAALLSAVGEKNPQLLWDVNTVSYTHLDVYKRQPKNSKKCRVLILRTVL